MSGIGGVIGARVVPSYKAASGVWRPSDIARLRSAVAVANGDVWPIAADPYYSSTTGLWQFTSCVSGAYPDTSSVGSNSATVGTGFLDNTQAKWSRYSMRGKPSQLLAKATAATAAGFNFGTGDFTIEGWVYVVAADMGGNQVILDMRLASEPSIRPLIYFTSTGVLNFYLNGGARITSASGVITGSAWQHWHVSRISGSTQMGVDGAQVGSTYTDGNTYTQGNALFGLDYPASAGFSGWFGPHRITKGVGRYSGSYTVPTGPFPDY